MPTNIFDQIKKDGLKSLIALIKTFFPQSKDAIDAFDKLGQDIANGTVSLEDVESAILNSLTLVEVFTDDKTDLILEQVKKAVHENIAVIKMLTTPKTV